MSTRLSHWFSVMTEYPHLLSLVVVLTVCAVYSYWRLITNARKSKPKKSSLFLSPTPDAHGFRYIIKRLEFFLRNPELLTPAPVFEWLEFIKRCETELRPKVDTARALEVSRLANLMTSWLYYTLEASEFKWDPQHRTDAMEVVTQFRAVMNELVNVGDFPLEIGNIARGYNVTTVSALIHAQEEELNHLRTLREMNWTTSEAGD